MQFNLRTLSFAFAVLATFSASAHADLVSVGTVGTTNMTAGTQSSTITVPIFNDSGSPATLLAWTLGLRIVPIGGATGTVTIEPTSIAYPASGSNIFSTPFPIQANGPTAGNDNPNAGDYTFSSSDAAGVGVSVPNSAGAKAMMTFKVNASANASGSFALQLVDGTGPNGTAGTFSNTFWNDENADPHNFLINGANFTNGVQIGQFAVTPAAVPEPGSMLLTGSVALIAGWRMRRKRRAAGETANADAASTTGAPSV